MKTSKSSKEECGVWLDTVELKGKAKQKRLVRPISKLLNHMAKCGGYSLDVALNFTQTKIQMPNTKQSSISSFFAPKSRATVVDKTEVLNKDPVYSPSSSSADWGSTSPKSTTVGTKRKRDVDLKLLGLQNTEECPDSTSQRSPERENASFKCNRKKVREGQCAAWQDMDAYMPYLNIDNESKENQDMNEPDKKKRLIGAFSSPLKADLICEQSSTHLWSLCKSPQQSQAGKDPSYLEPWECATHNTEAQYALTHHKVPIVGKDNDTTVPFSGSIERELGLGVWLGVAERTSIQAKTVLKTPGISLERDRKRNTPSSSLSPNRCSRSPLSNHKWIEPRSPLKQKYTLQQSWKRAEEECISLALSQKPKCTEQCSSSFQKQTVKQQLRENEEESLAMLFTQDSEGLRVIAHRDPFAGSPSKNQNNLGSSWEKRKASCETPLEKEEEEMLFTQDSQGNIVIKH